VTIHESEFHLGHFEKPEKLVGHRSLESNLCFRIIDDKSWPEKRHCLRGYGGSLVVPSMVEHACDPNYSGGRDREEGSSRPAWANS
jgi:hypothetical protein